MVHVQVNALLLPGVEDDFNVLWMLGFGVKVGGLANITLSLPRNALYFQGESQGPYLLGIPMTLF